MTRAHVLIAAALIATSAGAALAAGGRWWAHGALVAIAVAIAHHALAVAHQAGQADAYRTVRREIRHQLEEHR